VIAQQIPPDFIMRLDLRRRGDMTMSIRE